MNNLDQTISGVGHKFTIGGSIWSLFSWLASSQAGVLFGILLGITGLLVNWYFKRRQDEREQREHEARMRKLATKPGELL